jgi:ECF transporter S component (folate family)
MINSKIKEILHLRRNTNDESTYRLVVVALMIAMTLVLSRIAFFANIYKLSFDFIPVFIVAVLFGPFYSALTYAIADLLGAWLLPLGDFNPGITVSVTIVGAILGFVFYKKNCRGSLIWIRSFVATLLVFITRIFGTTYAFYFYFGGSYRALLISRLPFTLASALLMLIFLPITQRLIIGKIKH